MYWGDVARIDGYEPREEIRQGIASDRLPEPKQEPVTIAASLRGGGFAGRPASTWTEEEMPLEGINPSGMKRISIMTGRVPWP